MTYKKNIKPAPKSDGHSLRNAHYLDMILKNQEDGAEFSKVIAQHGVNSEYVRHLVQYIDHLHQHVKTAEEIYDRFEQLGTDPFAGWKYDETQKTILSKFVKKMKKQKRETLEIKIISGGKK